MNPIPRLPAFEQDRDILRSLGKHAGRRLSRAAGLGADFAPFNRNAHQLLAHCLRCTQIPARLTRQTVVRMCQAELAHAVETMPSLSKEMLSTPQLLDIMKALPTIAEELADDLKLLTVDEHTFERQVLDPVLIKHGARPFEVAIGSSGDIAFDFEAARTALRALAGGDKPEAVRAIDPEQVHALVKGSIGSLVEIVKKKHLRDRHYPVVLTDADNMVVGVSFQHRIHKGIVPLCCEGLERFHAVRAALFKSGQAQMSHISRDGFGMDDPNNIIPFGSGFGDKRPNLPQARYVRVSVEQATRYLEALEAAVDGERVPCTDAGLQPLKGAHLSWVDIGSIRAKTVRRRWGLVSQPDNGKPGKVMSYSGVLPDGILGVHQWYLRQIEWNDESSLPGLGLAPDIFKASPFGLDNDPTRIIPEATHAFLRRAKAHVKRMNAAQRNTQEVKEAIGALKEQEEWVRRIETALEAEEKVRIRLADDGLRGAIGIVPQ